MYGHDLASTRFSPLAQIDTENVSRLTLAWSYPMRPGGTGPSAASFSQVTPIVVNGVMYLPAGNRILALDPDTGREIWVYQRPTGLVSARGVAYWPGDGKITPRLFFTSGHQLVALDAMTGKPDPQFGNDGEVTMDVPFAEVPTIYKHFILVVRKCLRPRRNESSPARRGPGGCSR